jgi:phenylpyruvate tautomerase PptA (4-oxalocrotonate tautomerase family)
MTHNEITSIIRYLESRLPNQDKRIIIEDLLDFIARNFKQE